MASEPDARSGQRVPDAGSLSTTGDPSYGGEGAHVVSEHPAKRVAREDGRGIPTLERDPYRDEGGEG